MHTLSSDARFFTEAVKGAHFLIFTQSRLIGFNLHRGAQANPNAPAEFKSLIYSTTVAGVEIMPFSTRSIAIV